MGQGHTATLGSPVMLVRGVVIFLAALTASVILSNQVRQLVLSLSPPFSELGAQTDRAVIEPGDPLTMRYHFVRTRYCQTDLNLFVVASDTQDVVWRLRVPGGATLIGRADIRNTFQLTVLPEGRYILRTIAFSLCAEGIHAQAFPEAPFTVRQDPT